MDHQLRELEKTVEEKEAALKDLEKQLEDRKDILAKAKTGAVEID